MQASMTLECKAVSGGHRDLMSILSKAWQRTVTDLCMLTASIDVIASKERISLCKVEQALRRYLYTLDAEEADVGYSLIMLPNAQWNQLWQEFIKGADFVIESGEPVLWNRIPNGIWYMMSRNRGGLRLFFEPALDARNVHPRHHISVRKERLNGRFC